MSSLINEGDVDSFDEVTHQDDVDTTTSAIHQEALPPTTAHEPGVDDIIKVTDSVDDYVSKDHTEWRLPDVSRTMSPLTTVSSVVSELEASSSAQSKLMAAYQTRLNHGEFIFHLVKIEIVKLVLHNKKSVHYYYIAGYCGRIIYDIICLITKRRKFTCQIDNSGNSHIRRQGKFIGEVCLLLITTPG